MGARRRGDRSVCSLRFKQLDPARVPRVFPGKIAWEQASGVPLEAPPLHISLQWSAPAQIRQWLSQQKRAINSGMITTCLSPCEAGHRPKPGSSCLRLPGLPSPLQLHKGSASHVPAHGCESPRHEVQFLQVLCPTPFLTSRCSKCSSLLPEMSHLLYKVL